MKHASIVIGILENTGNKNTIKELALKNAQREPNIEKMVNNLRSVKEIRCNHPVFNPDSNYPIGDGSMAIVVETRNMG
jgi:voltage-gated potassium channel